MRYIARLAVILFLIAFTTPSWAVKNKFKGFYVGIDGGVDTWILKNDIQLFALPTDTVPFINTNNDTGQLGGSGGIFGGWAYVETQWYSSLEINFDLMSNKHASNTVLNFGTSKLDVSIDEKQQGSLSIDFHYGYIFGKAALLYLRVGYAAERFESSAKLTVQDMVDAVEFSDSYTKKTEMNVVRVGIGGEYVVQPNWRLRTEFFADFYQNKSYFLSDIPEIQQLTNGATIGAKRNFLAYYIGILRQF